MASCVMCMFKGLVNRNDNLILNDRKQKDKQDYHICWNQKYLGKSIFRQEGSLKKTDDL